MGAGTLVKCRDEASARRLELADIASRYPPIADPLRRHGLALRRVDRLVAKTHGVPQVVHLLGLEESKGLVFPAQRAGEIAALGIEFAQALVVERAAAPGENQNHHKLDQEKAP